MTATATSEVVPRKDQREKIRNKFQHFFLLVEHFLGGASGKEPARLCRRCKKLGFDPWVRKIPWRRKWHPTPVFLPGKFYGQRSLAGYSQQGRKESDMIEHVPTCAHTHTHTAFNAL